MLSSPNAESVRVVCRFRPQRSDLLRGASGQGGITVAATATAQKKSGNTDTNNPASGFKIDYAPDGKSIAFTPSVAAGGVKGRPMQFTFDQIFAPDTTQLQAFDGIAKETVASVLKGYNGSIFAYGQTGSGKTFTMFGSSSSLKLRGVIPRAADELFTGIADSEELEEVTIKCSFLEIYKEVIRDLLQPKNTNLKIRELPTGEVYVQGLSDEYVASCDDIMQVLAEGEKNRTVASTDMNEVSSRSHSVLIIVVNQKLKDGSVRVGKLNLADLAGSERIERTNATGETLEQAKKINQSLSALGNCINALTDSKRSHTPFRDSTLTFLLKDSLGGNSRTTILVCASPEENDCLETLSTLNFAKRAKKIKNSVSVNLKLGVAELTLMVAELRKELGVAHKTIVALQRTIKTMQAGGTIPKEMMDALLKPVQHTPGVQAIETLAGADVPLKDIGPVEANMLHQALEDSAHHRNTVIEYPSASSSSASVDDSIATELDQSTVQSPTKALEEQSTVDASEGLLSSSEMGLMPLPALPGSAIGTPRSEANNNGAPQLPSEDDKSAQSSAAPSTSHSPLTLPADSLNSSILTEQLSTAQSEIDALRAQLDSVSAAGREKEAAWAAEKERARQEREAQDQEKAAQAAAQAALAADLESKLSAGASDSERIAALLARNERLERQMSEMKQTWTAYLDLILENQKAEQKKRDEALQAESELHAATLSKNAKIIKPVRKAGFFSTLFRSNKNSPGENKDGESESATSSPVVKDRNIGGETSQPASAFTSPETRKNTFQSPPASSASQPGGSSSSYSSAASSPIAAAPMPIFPPVSEERSSSSSSAIATGSLPSSSSLSSSPTTSTNTSNNSSRPAGHSRAASTVIAPASRGNFDQSIRVGFLQKKPVGLSFSRQWKKRLFVLRADCLDYYDCSNVTMTPSAAPTPVGSVSTQSASVLSDSSPLHLPIGTSSIVPPSNLKEHFRGSLVLDTQTTVIAVNYTDVPYGFEVTTKDKHSKLCASSEQERIEWIKDLLAVVNCLKRGLDPLVVLKQRDEPEGFTLDPEILSNANQLLANAMDKFVPPTPDPYGQTSLASSLAEPQNHFGSESEGLPSTNSS